MNLLTKYPRKSQEIASRVIEQEAIIVVPQEGLARVLNAAGSRIWELLNGKNSTQDIIDTIILEFEVSQEAARDDVLDFLKELEDKKMVTMCDEPIA